jgi:phosphopantothenoylcysteine decarboxylase / phosphopantothenate---cysteine ligase
LNILAGKRVVLGVTGSIACYKLVDVARHLTQAGALVDVIMTAEATNFVAPLLFESLTYRPVYIEMWSRLANAAAHVKLGDMADAVLIAPATANIIAKLAAGIADDMLTTVLLATEAPILIAPAMEGKMYRNAATQANLQALRARGYQILEPVEGLLASGVTDKGRLPEGSVIEAELQALLGRRFGRLRGCRVVVSAGGTREPIDPVRYIGNRSSGRMGYALAATARDEGADVILVSGAVAVPAPPGVALIDVETTEEMRRAVEAATEGADILIMAAAVADYRPAQAAEQKIKKDQAALTLTLERTTDILQALSERDGMIRIGFAAETENLVEAARKKIQRKRLDLIVANDAVATIGADESEVTLIDHTGVAWPLPRMAKAGVADAIIDAIIERFSERLAASAQRAPGKLEEHTAE